MNNEAMLRVKEALTEHERGKNQYVELDSADIVALAGNAKGKSADKDERTQVIKDLHMGSLPHHQYANEIRRKVWIKVDQAWHLLEEQAQG